MKNRNNILLIITGSIAAYKSLDLIRLLRKGNIGVKCVLTKGGEEFVTPLSIASLSGNQVYNDLFSLREGAYIEHITLTREADLVVVAPASADIIARMANGLADDLATTTLLASDKKIIIAPAMNARMWESRAVARNINVLKGDGVSIVGPGRGELACGEEGDGKMIDPEEIYKKIMEALK